MASFSIANGESLSAGVDIGCAAHGMRIVAIVMPSAWTTANLTFQASYDEGTTYNNLYDDDGNEVTITAAASRCLVLDDDMKSRLSNLRLIKIRSGTSGSPVNQGAARTIDVITG